MLIVCREVDKRTGRICYYPIKCHIDDGLISRLKIREKCNPELTYWFTVMDEKRGKLGAVELCKNKETRKKHFVKI